MLLALAKSIYYLLLGLLVLRPYISSLLQSATSVITERDNFITEFDHYYKVRQNTVGEYIVSLSKLLQ